MKNIRIICVLVGILVLAACNKNTTPGGGSGNYGSWTFKNYTYPAVTCMEQAGPNGVELVAYSSTSPYAGDVAVVFDTLTPPAGTYFVTTGGQLPYQSNQVYITKQDSLNDPYAYGAIGGNGTETVQVSFVGGKLHITGSGIKMFNLANYADSNSTLSLNITQQ